MPFTDDAPIIDNAFVTGSVVISVSPSVSAINASAIIPGESVSATISVYNLGDVDANLFCTADFRNHVSPSVSTYAAQAQLLADKLNVSASVLDGGGVLFNGLLDDFINQPAATPLAPSGSVGVSIVVTLPNSVGPAYANIAMDFDFDFVATS